MPEAHAILWFLGAFLGLWGLSLLVRGLIGERTGPGRQCPCCGRALPSASLVCGACGFEAPNERAARARRRSWLMVGVGSVVEVLSAIAIVAGQRMYEWTHRDPDAEPGITIWECAAFATLVFSASLVAWAVVGDRSRGRKRCPNCWYDMAGATGLLCPECGRDAGAARNLYRSKRRWRWTAAGVVGVLASAAVWEVPRYRAGGVTAMVPTTVLIAGAWSLPDQLIMQNRTSGEDWSLLHRFVEGKVWDSQNRWMASKTRSMLVNPTSPDAFTRAAAFRQQMGWRGGAWSDDQWPDQRSAVIAFARWISGANLDIRARAANGLAVLWSLEPSDESEHDLAPYVPGLRAALSEADPAVALSAALMLAYVPSEHADTLPRALKSIGVSGPPFIYTGVGVFTVAVAHGGRQIAHASALQALKSDNAAERQSAVIILHQLFAADTEVQSAIRNRLQDPDDGVAIAAAGAVCMLRDDQAAPAVIASLRDRKDANTRQLMLGTLQACMTPADPAELGGLLRNEPDPGNQVTIATLLTLAAAGGQDLTPALAALRSAAQSQDREVSDAAKTALSTWESRKAPIEGK